MFTNNFVKWRDSCPNECLKIGFTRRNLLIVVKLDLYIIYRCKERLLYKWRYNASASAHKNMHEDCQTVVSAGDADVHRTRHRDYDLHQREGLAGLRLPLHAGVPELVLRVQHQLQVEPDEDEGDAE